MSFSTTGDVKRAHHQGYYITAFTFSDKLSDLRNWNKAEEYCREEVDAVAEQLGKTIELVELPAGLTGKHDVYYTKDENEEPTEVIGFICYGTYNFLLTVKRDIAYVQLKDITPWPQCLLL